jgi:hypothetical protein
MKRRLRSDCYEEAIAMILGFWVLFGALIGYAAAAKKGPHTAGGLIDGALSAFFRQLMFFLSGIDANRVKCPHCAEFIKLQAEVCNRCGADVVASAAV